MKDDQKIARKNIIRKVLLDMFTRTFGTEITEISTLLILSILIFKSNYINTPRNLKFNKSIKASFRKKQKTLYYILFCTSIHLLTPISLTPSSSFHLPPPPPLPHHFHLMQIFPKYFPSHYPIH